MPTHGLRAHAAIKVPYCYAHIFGLLVQIAAVEASDEADATCGQEVGAIYVSHRKAGDREPLGRTAMVVTILHMSLKG